MLVDLSVYKFALGNLKYAIESIVNCQKDVINYYQAEIDKIKTNDNYTLEEKSEKIQEFLTSINEIHSILRKNNSIINSMLDSASELEENLSSISTNAISSSNTHDSKEMNLISVIKNSCEKIYSMADEASDLLKSLDESTKEEKNVILENELQKMFRIAKETKDVLSGIKISDDSSENETLNIINEYLNYEIDRTSYISEEASKLLSIDKSEIFDKNVFVDFLNTLKDETLNIKNKIIELEKLYVNENNRTETVSITLLQNVLEEEYQKIVSTIHKLDAITGSKTLENEISFDREENKLENNNMNDVLSRQVELIGDSNEELTNYLLELKNGNYSSREIVQKLRDLYNKQIKNIENFSLETEELFEGNVVEKEQKLKDDAEYKKYCSVLNESFWNSRQRASEEGIKYPSALYENKVKEYQDSYLNEKYSISLEEVEAYISKYKEKYAEELYKSEVYENALYQLRKETNQSVQELCDEKDGLSILDTRVEQLVENDLIEIIREIGLEKKNSESNKFLFDDYKKNMTINKLITKKKIIEHQLSIIKLRAKKIKENLQGE